MKTGATHTHRDILHHSLRPLSHILILSLSLTHAQTLPPLSHIFTLSVVVINNYSLSLSSVTNALSHCFTFLHLFIFWHSDVYFI